jgi:hypothetical protein
MWLKIYQHSTPYYIIKAVLITRSFGQPLYLMIKNFFKNIYAKAVDAFDEISSTMTIHSVEHQSFLAPQQNFTIIDF